MIASLRGSVQERGDDYLVIDVSGVGMQVYVPSPLLDTIHIGDSIFIHTYLVVREDALNLYGFKTNEERQFFILLLGVNGIGPRSALNTLSTLSVDAMRRAVFHEQDEVFARVPGIGRKTAQKILLQLQDKIPGEVGLEPVSVIDEVDSEVMNALTALGYSVVEAQAAVQSIPREAPEDIESRLRMALQFFG